jgi:hypothetical protein
MPESLFENCTLAPKFDKKEGDLAPQSVTAKAFGAQTASFQEFPNRL